MCRQISSTFLNYILYNHYSQSHTILKQYYFIILVDKKIENIIH